MDGIRKKFNEKLTKNRRNLLPTIEKDQLFSTIIMVTGMLVAVFFCSLFK